MTTWNVDNFSLEAIAESGQVFTWKRLSAQDIKTLHAQTVTTKADSYVHNGAPEITHPTLPTLPPKDNEDAPVFYVASEKNICLVTQRDKRLYISTPSGSELSQEDEKFWKHYFALDEDYTAILHELEAENLLPQEIKDAAYGIRVLHQNWWDAAVSFIISQNSNIKRIQKSVDILMEQSVLPGTIPTAEYLSKILLHINDYPELRLGYRLPYLQALCKRALDGWKPLCLSRPYAPLETQIAELTELPGIGPKVASCICLYGLGYMNAVPRDTWIKKAEQSYNIVWHQRLGGIEQQLVFEWIRKKKL